MSEQRDTPERHEMASVLADNRRMFLSFLERRVGSRAVAEDILQNAFVRSIEKADGLREEGALIPWFYRMLRNAIIDHQRRRAAASRALADFASELETEAQGTEAHKVVCECIHQLAETLKPEYAQALRRIEVDGVSVKDYAEEIGISSSNAGVRVFRARDALRKQVQRSCGTCAKHGCIDCTCKATS
jgi:RNA polymerase sigma-70 factor (ECF subfamily)